MARRDPHPVGRRRRTGDDQPKTAVPTTAPGRSDPRETTVRPAVPTLALAAAVAAGVALSVASPASAVHEQIEVTGLTQNNRLVTFLAGAPGDITSTVKISGLGGDLLGIDYRPATGQLYGVVRADGRHRQLRRHRRRHRPGAVQHGRSSPAARPSSSSGRASGWTSTPPPTRCASSPTPTRTSASCPPTGRPASSAPPSSTAPSPRAALAVTAAAYVNNDNDPATGTTLYDLSSATDGLFVQNPPNAGVLVAVGTGLGLPVGEKAGFDVYTEGTANVALVSLVDRGTHDDLGPNLTTGAVNPASTMTSAPTPPWSTSPIPTQQ